MAIYESRKIERRVERIMDRMQSLRIKASDGQTAPETRRNAKVKLRNFIKDNLPLVYKAREQIRKSDDPDSGIYYDGHIAHMKAYIVKRGKLRHKPRGSKAVRRKVLTKARLVTLRRRS